jgi:hypothetical protein
MPEDRENEPRPEETIKYRGEGGKFVVAPGKEPGQTVQKRSVWNKTIKDLARPYTIEAFGTLLDIMRNEQVKDQIRLHAAETILAYGWGRPAALTWSDDSPTNPLVGYNTRELQKLLIGAIKQEAEVIDITPQEGEDEENE